MQALLKSLLLSLSSIQMIVLYETKYSYRLMQLTLFLNEQRKSLFMQSIPIQFLYKSSLPLLKDLNDMA